MDHVQQALRDREGWSFETLSHIQQQLSRGDFPKKLSNNLETFLRLTKVILRNLAKYYEDPHSDSGENLGCSSSESKDCYYDSI